MIKAVTIHLPDERRLNWDFDFSLQGTMRMGNLFLQAIPPWIRLEYCQCPACTLDPKVNPTCPVAEVLYGHARDLANRKSFERVNVDIYEETGQTLSLENVPLQTVVSELVRLAVFQYECPIGRIVKPAMAQLPPFPTNEEILYAFARAFATDAEGPSGQLSTDQKEFLECLHDLFGNLSVRLERVGEGDAHLNGIVILHSLAVLFTLSAPELISALAPRSGGAHAGPSTETDGRQA